MEPAGPLVEKSPEEKSPQQVEGLRYRRMSSVPRESISQPGVTWSGSQPNVFHPLSEGGKDGDVISVPNGRITLPLAITALVTILGSSFPHGWGTGVLNSPALVGT
jgi:hypothetical protein